ncbi:UNVERIFIED_CONTAM: hypothetical protein Slati_1063400 [Sesamum latifolium]|uniref:Uncharacterized protein n=1 Tax=Sesamum latifolium TaxID=2727402 RepID=A0AAW2XSU3_9LAMI
MVSLESFQPTPDTVEPSSSPGRISFSSEFLDESNFISICPKPQAEDGRDDEEERPKPGRNAEFEFLLGNLTNTMITADEVFSEGKLLPFWQAQAEKLDKISLKTENNPEDGPEEIKEESRISWSSLAEIPPAEETKEGVRSKAEKAVKRIKKAGQERTRTGSIRIRPMVNVPICTQAKNSALPPLFSLKKDSKIREEEIDSGKHDPENVETQ